jgi:hypothetical protein
MWVGVSFEVTNGFYINCTMNFKKILFETGFPDVLSIFNQNVRFLQKNQGKNIVYYAQ